jgi:hypothetical protein
MISGNTIVNAPIEGITFSGSNITVANNRIINASGAGIMFFALTGSHDVQIIGNDVNNAGADGTGSSVALVYGADTTDLVNVLVSGNKFLTHGSYSIQSYLNSGVTVQAGYTNVDIVNNQTDSSGSGESNLLSGVTNTDLVYAGNSTNSPGSAESAFTGRLKALNSMVIPNGASPGATCSVGDLFLDTDETVDTSCTTTADNSLCVCAPANTWTSRT